MDANADIDDPTNQVRLLIADVDPDGQIITDHKLTGYLRIEGENVKKAAAAALNAIAISEALVSKVIRTQDLATDGAKLSAELRAHAKRLREEAEDDAGGFDIMPAAGCATYWI